MSCERDYDDIDETDIAGRGMNVLHLAVHCADFKKAKKMVSALRKSGKLERYISKHDDHGDSPVQAVNKSIDEQTAILEPAKKTLKNLNKIKKLLTSGGKRKTSKLDRH